MYPESKGRELTERLLYHALAEAGMPDLKIMRTEKGKPYVQSAAEQDQAGRPERPNIYISANPFNAVKKQFNIFITRKDL